jgi:hypothetical protein
MLEGARKMIAARAREIAARGSPILSAGRARVQKALAPALAAGRGRYQKLEPRERLLVQIAGGLLVLFIAYNLIYLPIQGSLGGLGGLIQERQHDAVEVAQLMRSYRRLHVDLATMITPAEKTIPGGMKQYTVELKLNGLSLPQVVDTLYGLSALSVPVTVSTLHVTRRSQDQHTFDVEMTCVALGRSG